MQSSNVLWSLLCCRFNADTSAAMRWQFRPHQKEIKLVPGETALAFYTARNPTDKPVTGIATYNVIPFEAGLYFNKIQCFCFEEQRLNPREQVYMHWISGIKFQFTILNCRAMRSHKLQVFRVQNISCNNFRVNNAPIIGNLHSPTPELDGEIVGFDRVPCQEPLPWGVTICQYTYPWPRIDRGLIGDLMWSDYIMLIAHVNFTYPREETPVNSQSIPLYSTGVG